MLFAALCLIPLTASASYQPGQTLNPTCPPSDGTCVVVASTSPWTTSGSNIYYTGGNVGIGTTSPSQALSVQGNGLFSGVLTASVANVTGLTATNATTTNLVATNATTTNLAVSGAFTGGSILINQSGTGYAFSPPTFGGPWLANHQLSTNYTSTHSSDARTTLSVSRNSSGSGVNGPATADYGAFITSQKTNYLTSNVNGEIDGLYLITAQGTQGDSSGLAIDANKVYGGGNGVNGVEAATQWMDSSGNKLMNVHSIVGFGEGTGGQSGNSGYGFYTDSWGASPSTASPQVQPWAAFYGGAYDANGNCPMHCPTFTNLLVGAGSRSSPGDIYFDITGGLNQAGNIAVGSGNATGSDGNPTQSGGTRWSMENVNGDWRLYANNGTTNLLTVKQSGWVGIGTSTLAAQLEVSASFPAIALNDTHSSVTSGGLTRFSTLGNGITIFQINTAAAGDFSTGIPVYAINSTGNFGLGTTSPQSKLAVAAGATIGADYNLAAPTNGLIIEGNVGIGTTTPGSLLSVNGIANFSAATSTFYSSGGLNITGGCYAVNGTCLPTAGGGSSFAFPWTPGTFGSMAENSTSTLIGFTNGLYALASSTIGNGTLGLTVNGPATTTGQAYFAGWVGIGTSTPAAQLEVSASFPAIALNDTHSSVTSGGLTRFSTLGNGITIFQINTAAAGDFSTGIPVYAINSTGNFGLGTTSPQSKLAVAAGATIGADYNLAAPTNGLIIEGNVGIGTTTPGSLLSVNGIANFTSATSSFYSTGGINLAAGCFAIAGNCVSLSSLSGLVGVASGGTGSTAFGQGWIYSAGGTAALIASTSPTINYFVATSTTATSSIATGGLAVGGTQFIVQQLSGKVGIGTNSFTTNVLEVNGNTRFFSAGAGDLTIAHFGLVSTVRSASGIQLALGAGGNEALRINTSGNVGIGTTTPYSRLSVWGTDTASSTLAFNVVNNASTTMFAVFDGGNAQLSGTLTQSSDARLKTNIQSLDASTSLASINSLIPVAYDWLDPNKDGIRQYGFIAQQVEPVFPNLVSTTSATALTPDGTLGLNYIGLIAPVIRAIQALSTEISSLENSIAGFADSFTTKELTFTRATGDEIDVRKTQTHELCVDDICVTRDQLAAVLATANATQVANSSAAPSNQGSDASSTSDGPPVIQINGNNPAHVKIGDSYADLGAIITGPQADLNLGIKTFLNGALTSNIVIDTLSVATDTIDYVVTDQNGLSATSTRTIIVEAATSSVQ